MSIDYENLWKAVEEIETNAFIFVNHEGQIENINRGVTALMGFGKNDLIGRRIENILPDQVKEFHKSRFNHYVKSRNKEVECKSDLIGTQRIFPATVFVEEKRPLRFSILHKDGQEIPITLTINEIWSDTAYLIGFIAIISDNTEQYQLNQRLKLQADYDQLTGLISWQKFVNEVTAKKKDMAERNITYKASLLFIDVDYFNIITYRSQKAGDFALGKVANWLLLQTRQKNDRPKDKIVTYFLSNVFLVYLPNTTIDGALTPAKRLKADFTLLNLGSKENPFFTTISIGVIEITPDMRLHDAVSHASHACKIAKKKGKNKIEIARNDSTNYLQLEPVIRKGLQDQRLKLFAQKIVPISSKAKLIDNNRAHYEVLSRMYDEQGNMISPVIFIPAAENMGQAFAIDKYVIEHVFATLQNNPAHARALSLCSINLSGISVANELMFSFIKEQIGYYGIAPHKLCFEITETSKILDLEVARKLVSQLRELGCKVAFDDFGIGYSNYQSFSRLHVDIIKIDGSYVRHVLENDRLRTDMEGMIHSAKSRGLEIVGEYVETEEISRELERLGVDYAQGFHYSQPIPLESLIAETTHGQ